MEFYKFTKLDDADGDFGKRQEAYYFFINPETYKFVQIHEYVSSRFKIKKARYSKLDEIKKYIVKNLLDDWSPFQEELPELINLKTALKLFNKHTEKSLWERIIQTYSPFIDLIIIWSYKVKIKNM